MMAANRLVDNEDYAPPSQKPATTPNIPIAHLVVSAAFTGFDQYAANYYRLETAMREKKYNAPWIYTHELSGKLRKVKYQAVGGWHLMYRNPYKSLIANALQSMSGSTQISAPNTLVFGKAICVAYRYDRDRAVCSVPLMGS